MSRVLAVSGALVLGLAAAVGAEGAGKWEAALYLAGDSDLWQTAQYAADRLMAGAPGIDLVVFLDGPPGSASRGRFSARRDSGWRHEDWGRVNTGAAATLRHFTRSALVASAAPRRLLLILGHGRPPASISASWRVIYQAGGLGVDWGAGGDCLTPAEVEWALCGQRWDVVVLACCYSMSMEMGWSLRGTGGMLVGAPGTVSISGAELVEFVGALGAHSTPFAAARAAAAMLGAGEEDFGAGWAETRGMVVLGNLVKELGAAMLEDAPRSVAALEVVRPLVQTWGPGGEIADLGALAQALSDALPTARGREAARAVARAAGAVVRLTAREQARRLEGKLRPAGLGIFLPPQHTEPWAEYESEVPFGRVSGWVATLTELYKALAPLGANQAY